MIARRTALFSSLGFPLVYSPETKGQINEQIEAIPLKYYLWIFSQQEADYVPTAVFNTKDEADKAFEKLKKDFANKNNGNRLSGAVLELTWNEFVSMACQVRLGEIAKALDNLGVKV